MTVSACARPRAVRTAFAVLAILSGGVGAARAQVILGTGAAFAQPIYVRWGRDARASTGVELNYQASGSGVGQNQVIAGLSAFGASDAPMAPTRLRAADLLQFPTVVGGIAIIVNLPGIGADRLRLDGPVLASIFDGRIMRWNDPRIERLNPGLALPGYAIAPLYHAAASGATAALSRYLADESDEWRRTMGTGLALSWPAGEGVRGSYGAASTVPRVRGSIGYAEISYVTAAHLTTIRLRNRSGAFVAPGSTSFAAASAAADWANAPDFAADLIDVPGPESWPIVTATFVLLPRKPAKATTTRATEKLFAWAFAHGDDDARALQYVPLPDWVKAAIERRWSASSP